MNSNVTSASIDMRGYSRANEVLSALSNELRLELLMLLNDGPKTVKELQQLSKVRQPTVSQQLKILKTAGLVSVKTSGRLKIYSLVDDRLIALIGSINSFAPPCS